MTPVVCVDLLNLACCAVEAARGFELWRSQMSDSKSVVVTTAGEFAVNTGSVPTPDLSILVVAGTVSQTQGDLVVRHYESLPEPRAAVAFGVCTISGGPYWDSYAVLPGIEGLIDVDVMVPGCPPLPEDVIAALNEVIVTKLGLTIDSSGLASTDRDTKAEAYA